MNVLSSNPKKTYPRSTALRKVFPLATHDCVTCINHVYASTKCMKHAGCMSRRCLIIFFIFFNIKSGERSTTVDPAARIVKVTAMMAGLMEWSNAHEWVVTTKLGKWVANKVEKVG